MSSPWASLAMKPSARRFRCLDCNLLGGSFMATTPAPTLGIQVVIHVETGALEGMTRTFCGPRDVLLGRHRDADISFPEQDGFVSQRHLGIKLTRSECVITDVGSTNGTWAIPKQEQIRSLRLIPAATPYRITLGSGGPTVRIQVSNTIPFGSYRVIGQLGNGGMATVFVATESTDLNRLVVLKLIHPNLLYSFDKKSAGGMLIEEAQIVSQITHPNVVGIHDVGVIGGVHYIAMEYLRGVNLAHIIESLRKQDLRFPFELAAALIAQACWGLHAAHEAQDASGRPLSIVHRDFTPSNLVVSPEGDVKLIDFGVARAVGRQHLNEAGQFVGKPAYASPEQIQATTEISRTSDLFSAAIVLYELCAMQPLFLRNSDAATMFAVLHDPVPSIKGIPSELAEILNRGLAKDPTQRIQTAKEMATLLEKFVMNEGGRYLTHRSIAEMLTQSGVSLRAAPPSTLLGWPEIFPVPSIDSAAAGGAKAKVALLAPPSLQPPCQLVVAGQEYQVESLLSERSEVASDGLVTRTLLAQPIVSHDGSSAPQRHAIRLFGTERGLGSPPPATEKRLATFAAKWQVLSKESSGALGALIGYGQAWPGGPWFAATPYYSHTLASLKSGKYLREEERRLLGQRLCGALVAMNQLWPGFVHGQLSPSRIALPYFDSAVRPAGCDRLTVALLGIHPNWLCGVEVKEASASAQRTPQGKYTPPERIAGIAPSQAGDVYSIAAILYELYGGDIPQAVKSLARGLPIVITDGAMEIPASTGEALAAALSPNPSRRPTAVELLRRLTREQTTAAGALPIEVPRQGQSITVGDKSKITLYGMELVRRDCRAPVAIPLSSVPGLLPVGIEVSIFESGVAVDLRDSVDSLGQRVRLYEGDDHMGRSRVFLSGERGRFEIGNRKQSWLQSIDYQRLRSQELQLSDGPSLKLLRSPEQKDADHLVLQTRDTRSGVTHLVSISIGK